MPISVKSSFKWNGDEIIASVRKSMKKAAEEMGEDIKQEAINLMRSSGGGAGAPPQVRTGKLVESTEVRTEETPDRVEVRVGVWNPIRAQIAMWLEYGTSRMPPHPFLRPALRAITGKIGKYFR